MPNRRAVPVLACASVLVLLGAIACGTDGEAAREAEGPGAPDAGGGSGGSAPGGAPEGGAPTGGTGGATGGSGGEPAVVDAGPPLPDLGAPESGDPCPAACDRVWTCTAEACGADAGVWRNPVTEACLHECRANPSLALAMTGEASCDAVVQRARTDIGQPFQSGCPDGAPEAHHAVCDVFGERFATCLDERCDAIEGYGGDLIRAYTRFCDNAINSGDFSADQLGVLITPRTMCDSPVVEMFLGDAVGEDGPLHAFCEQGPLVPSETCTAACERFVPCLTEDYGLVRDADTCAFVCLATESLPAERWACGAALDAGATCEAALACAEGGGPAPVDPVVTCQPYAERITACAVERCGGLAEVAAGHTLGVRDFCVEQIQSGAALAADFAAVTADTPCDASAVAALVDALVGEGGIDAPLCEAGPLNPIEALCRPACAVISPCLPAEGEFSQYREPSACEFLCAQAPADLPPAVWTCFADAPDCATAFACVP
ncbi:hypothetical protein L6V77_02510 [Myxococcota bacterium]|nr:hypothetical protein [Myxococcota bacterium]